MGHKADAEISQEPEHRTDRYAFVSGFQGGELLTGGAKADRHVGLIEAPQRAFGAQEDADIGHGPDAAWRTREVGIRCGERAPAAPDERELFCHAFRS
jgi:hypothetical protein